MAQQKSIKLNMILNLIRTLLGLLFPLITFPYASRVLGPEGIGIVNYSQSIIGYFALISSFGIGTYAVREVSKVRDDRILTSKLAIEILLLNLTTTLIAFFLFFIVVFSIDSLYLYKNILYVCSLSMLLTTIGIDWLYVSNEDYLYITIRSIIVNIFSLIFLFILVRTKEDVLNYAILIIISSAGANVYNIIHSRKYIDWSVRPSFSLTKHFKYVVVFFVTALTATLHTILDQSMLGFISGVKSVGIYVTAVKISNIVTAVICAMTATMFPRLSYLVKNSAPSVWKTLLSKTIDFLLLLSMPILVLLTILGKNTVVILAGYAFMDTVPVLYIMNLMIIIVVFTNIIGNQLFMAINKEKWTMISVVSGAILNVVLNALLIPHFAAEGAAVATVCSEGLVVLIQFFLLSKIFPIISFVKNSLVYLMNSILMGVIVWYAVSIMNVNIILQTCLAALLGGIVYISLLFLEGNSLAKELKTIAAIKMKKQ